MADKTVPSAALRKLPREGVADEAVARARRLVREQRDLELEIQDAEESLAAKKAQLNTMKHETLVTALQEAGLTEMSLAAEGNAPPLTARLKPYYKAAISASWEDERKDAAFAALEGDGAGDLIRRVFSVSLGPRDGELAQRVRAALDTLGVEYEEMKSVPWASLTAYVREQTEKGRVLPLDVLGATVGHVVDVKIPKQKQTKGK